MSKRWLFGSFVFLTFVGLALGQPKPKLEVAWEEVDARLTPVVNIVSGLPLKLKMLRGTSAVLTSRRPIDKFALGDPQIVAVNILTERELVINAKLEGSTNIIVWEQGAVPTPIWVEVSAPSKEELPPKPPARKLTAEEVEKFLKRALEGLNLSPIVLSLPDETLLIVLRGEVSSQDEGKAIESLAQSLAPKVVNMLKVRPAPEPPQVSPEEPKTHLIERAIGIEGVKVTIVEDKIVLHGQVSNLSEKLLAEERTKPFGTVINRLEVTNPTLRQFITDVMVLEVSRNALQKLGVTLGTIQVAGTATGGAQTKIFNIIPGQAVFGEETVEQPLGKVSPLGAQINALIQTGQARLLANPQQRTIEGADATFLVGGLVPIPVFGFFGVGAGAAAPGAATVIFFPFGITLTLHPEATYKGEIFLQMRVEVTAPDFGLATQVLGTTVPGFRFRGIDDVRLMLRNGETVVISGLIQDELREQINRFPILSKIPVLGELFKSREFARQQTDLVIAITVHMEEIAVTEDALRLMQNYQKRTTLPRPSFGLPTGMLQGFGSTGFSAGVLPTASPIH